MKLMKPRGCLTPSPTPNGGGGGGGGGGTPSRMAAAGAWMLKPRENPKSLFIRDASEAAALSTCDGHRGLQVLQASRVEEREDNTHHHDHDHVHQNHHHRRDHFSAMVPQSAKEAGYSIDTSASASADELADFTVTRENFGSVRWLEPVSLRHLAATSTAAATPGGRGNVVAVDTVDLVDISRVVRIERGAVFVYDADCGVRAPPPGEGLKKRVEITLLGCLPTRNPGCLHARTRYEEKVVKATRKMGGALLEYNAYTGTWRFALQL